LGGKNLTRRINRKEAQRPEEKRREEKKNRERFWCFVERFLPQRHKGAQRTGKAPQNPEIRVQLLKNLC
jgi:hypothetical protein